VSRTQSIGFSQRIQLDWLEYTAQAYAAGAGRDDISAALQEMLREKQSVGGTALRGSREKTITILLKCWVTVPAPVIPLRDRGAQLIHALPQRDHLALHWGMSCATYPFFGLVAETTGRLLSLQGEAPAAQVQRRLRESLGERETVSRAARRLLRMFVDWGVLGESGSSGVYARGRVQRVERADLAAWLVEVGLAAAGAPIAVSSLGRWPTLFPFDIAVPPTEMISQSDNLTLLQYEGGSPALAVRTAP
jgi:hypothetical protein